MALVQQRGPKPSYDPATQPRMCREIREKIRFGLRPLPLRAIASRLGFKHYGSLEQLAGRYERCYGIAPDYRETPDDYAAREEGHPGIGDLLL